VVCVFAVGRAMTVTTRARRLGMAAVGLMAVVMLACVAERGMPVMTSVLMHIVRVMRRRFTVDRLLAVRTMRGGALPR
jgi:hypothetical protein